MPRPGEIADGVSTLGHRDTIKGGHTGLTGAVCNVSHYWSREQKNKQKNNAPRHKNDGAAGYLDPAKIELRTGTGLLEIRGKIRRVFVPLARPSYNCSVYTVMVFIYDYSYQTH